MKKILALLVLIPSLVFAETGSDHLWEKARWGDKPGIQLVNLYGFNGAIPATFEAVWPESADYIPQIAALSSPYCASASANDAAAGTGARTILITGIKTDFTTFSETVTLNGTTSVVLATTNILLFNSGEVITAGSGLMAAGIIQCGTGANTAGDPAVTHFYLPAGSETAVTGSGNKTTSFIYGVPAGYTMLCRNIQAGSVFATAAAGMVARIHGYTNSTGIHKLYYQSHTHNTGSNPSLDPTLIKIPEKTILVGKLAGSTGSNVGPADLKAECLLINNTWEASSQELF